MSDHAELPFAPAAERNAEPILEVLREWLGARDRVLEIGSGTGQHAVRFARELPGTRWLPSDVPAALPALYARIAAEGGANIERPLALDIARDPWPEGPFDACLSVNTLHVMAPDAVAALFGGASSVLSPGGALIVYGPLAIGGGHTGEGNRAFDAALRAADPAQGVRDLDELDRYAAATGFAREALVTMPADNRMVRWRRARDRAVPA